MHLTEIRLVNFGQYSGEHVLDLRPSIIEGEVNARPIILIGGNNGSGKTTILEAVKLCLYGAAFLGLNTKRQIYESYLARRIHRRPGSPLANTFSEVGVKFTHAIDNESHEYQVNRYWERNSSGLAENLIVYQNGIQLTEQEYTWWNSFIYDLLPPGLADLFFFDGEKIQELADDPDYTALGTAIRALLGLDLVDRLRTDLKIYLTKQKQNGQLGIEQEFEKIRADRKIAEEVFQQALTDLGSINSLIEYKLGKIEEEERRLASEGGNIYLNRNVLNDRADNLRAKISNYQKDLEEFASGLLPFATVPYLCQELYTHLIEEEKTQEQLAIKSATDNLTSKFTEKIIQSEEWYVDIELSSENRKRITENLLKLVQAIQSEISSSSNHETFSNLVHDISRHERQELLNWIVQATTTVPQAIGRLGVAIDKTVQELTEIEKILLNMPAEEVIKPILERIADLTGKNEVLKHRRDEYEAKVRDLRFKRDELERKEQELYTRLMKGDDPKYRLELAQKVQLVLSRYEEALRQAKLKELEQKIAECFGRLIRKGNYVKKVSINPKTFETALFNQKNDVLPMQDLSAGEKQIYAIAVLWALRQVSGRSVPIIVDTPLGRLDSEHRQMLVERYFPQASHQVILLSTDTEIDSELFQNLEPAVARAYQLIYQPGKSETIITDGFFWQNSLEEGEEALAI